MVNHSTLTIAALTLEFTGIASTALGIAIAGVTQAGRAHVVENVISFALKQVAYFQL